MSDEFEGDLTDAVFWGADLTGARFRDVNFTNVSISHAWLIDVDIDALVQRVVINGVDVTEFVNERDAWFPLRTMIRASDPEGMAAAWRALDAEWATTLAQASAQPERVLHETVDGEWTFVQTLRHLVFAMDKWFTVPILGERFDPIGMPNSGSVDFPWPDLDDALTPTFADAIAVRADRSERFRDAIESIPASEYTRSVEILENGPHGLLDCLHTVLEEEFWHLRYARRDLERLGVGSS